MNILDEFEDRFEEFNNSPNSKNLEKCMEIASECIGIKLENLGFEYDSKEEMFQQAVIAQLISDDREWLELIDLEVNEDNLHRVNNKFLLLLNNLKYQ